MLDSLNSIDIALCKCNYMLIRAVDSKNIDSFNFWMAERARLQRERVDILHTHHKTHDESWVQEG